MNGVALKFERGGGLVRTLIDVAPGKNCRVAGRKDRTRRPLAGRRFHLSH